MSYTLLVIDMQQGFLSNFSDEDEADDVIYGVQEAVTRAVEDGAEIIDVNYRGSYGPTISEIRHLWRDYKKQNPGKVKKVVKPWDGGGVQVMEAEPEHCDNMIACGINLGACVRSTVIELQREGADVRIIRDATANSWGERYNDEQYFEDILI